MRELHPDHNRPDNSATHDQIAAVVDAYRKLRGPDPIDESNSAPDWSTAKQWAGAEHDQPFEFDPRNEGGHTPPVRLLRPMVVVTVLVLSAWLVIFGLIAFAQSGENGTVDRQNAEPISLFLHPLDSPGTGCVHLALLRSPVTQPSSQGDHMGFTRKITAIAAIGVVVGATGAANAANGPMAFEPIAGSAYAGLTSSWTEPFIVPDGFSQRMVADETVLNIYGGSTDDLTDMNTVNETGRDAGRYLYRTHEVSVDGALSVVDLRTGEAKVIAQNAGWRRLDGLRWTPWGTILFAEETTGGRLFEAFLDPADPTTVQRVETRSQLGILRHEGIGVGPDGSVYVIDELNGGSIFRFVPDRRGDLSSGQLFALRISGLGDTDQAWNPETYQNKIGAFEWVALNMAVAVVDAKAAADLVHATEFGRPEDVEIIANTLYVANTSEERVVAIDLTKKVVTSFVLAGDNVPSEDRAAGVTGFNNPDNLAKGPDGALWIVEDNVPSDIWVAYPDNDGVADTVELFASMVDSGAEGTGIYFGKDPHTLFVNVQHPAKELADGTWVITKD